MKSSKKRLSRKKNAIQQRSRDRRRFGSPLRLERLEDRQLLSVAPTFTSPDGFDVVENRTSVGAIVAVDNNDPVRPLTYSISGGDDVDKFVIVGNQLRFKTAPNYEAPTDNDGDNYYEVRVTAKTTLNDEEYQDITVAVIDVNDAPVLSGAGSFANITEDDIANQGAAVSSLIFGKVTDDDAGAIRGIAITGFDPGNGVWQYKRGSGPWQLIGTVTDTNALLLEADARVRLLPGAVSGTTASLLFRAWDQTAGTADTHITTSPNGGATAFSTATATATITVDPVNDAPTLSGASNFNGITEDQNPPAGTSVQALIAGKIADVDPAALAGIAITQTTGDHGTWQYWTNSTDGWQPVGAVSGAEALLLRSSDLLRFLPDGSDGTLASITFLAWDQSSGTAGMKANAVPGGGTTAFSVASAVSTLQVAALNDAPVLTGANALVGITEDDTTAANLGSLVSELIDGTVTDVDTAAVTGIAIYQVAGSNGAWEFSTDNGTTWTNIGTVSAAQALLLAGADRVRFKPDGTNGTTATLSFRAWDQTTGTAGDRVSIVTNGGTTAFSSATATATLAVASLNDAPVLTPGGTFSPITEDQTDAANIGNTVAELIDGKTSDADASAARGIAVYNSIAVNGKWQFSTDGANWTDFGTLSSSKALLLRDTDRVRFLPDGLNGGTSTIFYRAWDQTTGTAESTADTTDTGGTTAFSSAIAAAAIVVASVNDAPVLTGANALVGITEDDVSNANLGNSVSELIDATASDVDTAAATGIAVYQVAGSNGTWQFSTDNGATWTNIGTVSATQALLLAGADRVRFLPNGENGTTATISFRDWDQTTGTAGDRVSIVANGGTTAFSSATATATLAVASVNDAPVLTGTRSFSTITEDQTDTTNTGSLISELLDGKSSDVDASAARGIAIYSALGATGKWQFSTNGSSWTDFGTVSTARALLLRDTDRVRFLPNGENGGTATISYRAWDQTAGTAGNRIAITSVGGSSSLSVAKALSTLAIRSLNDAPVLDGSNAFAQITEDQQGTSTVAALIRAHVSDVDVGAQSGIAIYATSNGDGRWQYRLASGAWTNMPTFSANAALLLRSTDSVRFVPKGTAATTASISFRAWDQTTGAAGQLVRVATTGGTTAFSSQTATSSITVTALNDAPVLTGANAFTSIASPQANNPGNTVASLLENRFSDADPTSERGIAVTGLSTGSGGTWQYSSDYGATWINVGAVSNTSALLLRATDRLRFVPFWGRATTASISFRAWDRSGNNTTGPIRPKVSTAVNGGTSMFSAAVQTSQIRVYAT